MLVVASIAYSRPDLVPTDAVITLPSLAAPVRGSFRNDAVKPGSYPVRVTRQGFAPLETTAARQVLNLRHCFGLDPGRQTGEKLAKPATNDLTVAHFRPAEAPPNLVFHSDDSLAHFPERLKLCGSENLL